MLDGLSSIEPLQPRGRWAQGTSRTSEEANTDVGSLAEANANEEHSDNGDGEHDCDDEEAVKRGAAAVLHQLDSEIEEKEQEY
jgi:hypothetical protein